MTAESVAGWDCAFPPKRSLDGAPQVFLTEIGWATRRRKILKQRSHIRRGEDAPIAPIGSRIAAAAKTLVRLHGTTSAKSSFTHSPNPPRMLVGNSIRMKEDV